MEMESIEGKATILFRTSRLAHEYEGGKRAEIVFPFLDGTVKSGTRSGIRSLTRSY
jgi:hypothetical protein